MLRKNLLIAIAVALLSLPQGLDGQEISEDEWNLVKSAERQRIEAIQKVTGSVIAIYDVGRQGGGSGVIIDPSGLALTNHHVIMGAGVRGWGGLADGRLYEWDLVGTDPGGDVAMIQMKGLDKFPSAAIGDSDLVQVGDWALAMGNPFVLTEDQVPTVTLGIISGVKRFQEGAGQNQLIYGNCIQVDSSINPGNSGGPLFNLASEVIGINGRGSFLDRGRVNVGLGYAISSNQIKNFLADLLATKLVEHGTLDANFGDQDGRVVCTTINELGPIAEAGLALGDELLEFEGVPISSANQFTNLICTLPERWPARLLIRKIDGSVQQIDMRLLGLPYARPPKPPELEKQPKPEEKQQHELQRAMFDLLAAEPGTIRLPEVNQRIARHYLEKLGKQNTAAAATPDSSATVVLNDQIFQGEMVVGTCQTKLRRDGSFRVERNLEEAGRETFVYDGKRFAVQSEGAWRELTSTESKLTPWIVQAVGLQAAQDRDFFDRFGSISIDGSDKALGQPSFRFRCLDSEEDWFYFWMTTFDPFGKESYALAKASADENCEGKAKGVTFVNWQPESGWLLAKNRNIIAGLAEAPWLRLQTESIEFGASDQDLFNLDRVLEPKK